MGNEPNILSTPTPWNLVAQGYSRTTMEILGKYSEEAIQRVKPSKDSHLLDVACGPGTLSLLAAPKVAKVTSVDFSENMLEILNDKIETSDIPNIETYHGDGQNLKLADNHFDHAFSMFGLMFFPDRKEGISELHRTLKPCGTALISSWAPVDQSPAMLTMFGALQAMNPDIPKPETVIDSLENPEVFEKELKNAGFEDVTIQSVSKGFPVNSIEEFWEGMVAGSAPIVMMKNKMGIDEWKEKEKLAIAYLEKVLPPMPTTLSSDAWFGFGRKS